MINIRILLYSDYGVDVACIYTKQGHRNDAL